MAMMTRRWSGVAKEKYSRVELYSAGLVCPQIAALKRFAEFVESSTVV